MNRAFEQWLDQSAPDDGTLACAVRCADGALVGRSWADGFTAAALENALRCVADLFQVIERHHIAPGRVRWVFGNALLHGERRADGACFGVFTVRDPEALPAPLAHRVELDRRWAAFEKNPESALSEEQFWVGVQSMKQ